MRTLRVAPFVLGAALTLASSSPAFTQTTSDAYYDFLFARHLEALGDNKGAQAQLEKAAADDPQSAEVRAELAAFHLRRDDADDAERIAKQALALDDSNSEAHRVLGLLYALEVGGHGARTGRAIRRFRPPGDRPPRARHR